jgi:hypothetical protein
MQIHHNDYQAQEQLSFRWRADNIMKSTLEMADSPASEI